MSLTEEYPKTRRDFTAPLRLLFQRVPGLGPTEGADYALAINEMADKAHDLDDIVRRLIEGQYSPVQLGELLIAFELTTEQLRGASDIINGKLYEVGDRLKGRSPDGKAGPKESA
jgi:hypothetical protein